MENLKIQLRKSLVLSAASLGLLVSVTCVYPAISGGYREIHNEMADKYGHRSLPTSHCPGSTLLEMSERFAQGAERLAEATAEMDEEINAAANVVANLADGYAENLIDQVEGEEERGVLSRIKNKFFRAVKNLCGIS